MSQTNFTSIKKLPSEEEMIRAMPLSDFFKKKIKSDREEIKAILENNDQRLLVIVGPCSAWPKDAVLEYAERLSVLSDQVKHRIKLVMRVYAQKSRTSVGWAGPASHSDPFGPPDLEAGMRYTRDVMIQIISMGLPVASEIVFTQADRRFIDLLAWAAIGARSSEATEHRVFVSSVDLPVGMKNPTSGHLSMWFNGVVVAQRQHNMMIDDHEVRTHGNQHAHLVLRGCNGAPNYSLDHLKAIKQHMLSVKINHPVVLIDASHDNCIINGRRDPLQQPIIILDILNQLKSNPDLRGMVKGFMIESFLRNGNQILDIENPADIDLSGLSVTDPCLGWDETEEIIHKIADVHCNH
jgi:3-deoxy-7-phosphoheptulonate synthase